MSRASKVKKQRKSKKIEYCSYVIRIEDWTTSYSLSVDRKGRFDPGPYWEHGALEIIGVVLAPAKLQNRKIKVDFLADRRLPAHKPPFPR